MFYLLLILPHVLAIVALLGYALCTAARGTGAEPDEGAGGGGGGGQHRPPSAPQPSAPRGGVPLGDADPPWRRLRVGERLGDLHRPATRRDRGPHRPKRAPAER